MLVDSINKNHANKLRNARPAQALLRLNRAFEMEKELDGPPPPEEKKKERLNREIPLLEAFGEWCRRKCENLHSGRNGQSQWPRCNEIH